MKTAKHGLLSVLAAGFMLLAAGCDNGTRSEVTSNGQTIIVEGGTSHNISSTDDGHHITVDGKLIAVSDTAIVLGDRTIPLPAGDAPFTELKIMVGDGGAVTLELDGAPFPPG